MKADQACVACCRNKVERLLLENGVSKADRESVMEQAEEVLKKSGTERSAPVLMAEVLSAAQEKMKVIDIYAAAKKKYNELLLEKEADILKTIEREADSFFAGLQYAITGNYIDFGAMDEVEEGKLEELLDNRSTLMLNEEETGRLRDDLKGAKRLLYITDNAGEIVLDKIFIRELQELYPQLEIAVLVRGLPTLNDATYEDAKRIGLTDMVRVIPNGTGIPGTPLERISKEALEWMDSADLCIAKGQGNFETLRGCERNIYYLFLCKCDLFVKKFAVERFAPVLKNEKRIVQYA